MSQSSSLPPDGAAARARQTEYRLHGNMSTLQLGFAVLAYNAPLAVLATVTVLVIGFGIGIGAPLLFIALGLLMGLFAVGYTVMSRHLPHPGAFYSYITAGLGRPLGLGSSFVAMLSYTIAMIAALIFTSNAIEMLVHTTFHGPDITWWVWALAFVATVAILGYRRVDVSAKLLGILLSLEFLIVVVWDTLVIGSRGAAGQLTFSSFSPHVALSGSVSVGLIFAVTCFSGFEATAIFRDEVRDPEKTVPRATYLTIVILTIFYSVSSWAIVQALGEHDAISAIAADPLNVFFNMVTKYLGTIGFHLVNMLIITGGFAGMMAYHNVLSRYIYSLGIDGILPRAIGVPHPRLRSPHRASLLLSTLTGLGIIGITLSGAAPSDVFVQLNGITGYSFVILFALAAIGIAAYLGRNRLAGLSLWQRLVAPSAAAILITIIACMATSRIDLLTNSPVLSTVALGLTFGSVLAGVILALVFRALKPEVFARIGRQ
ncbi:APC family permease [Burkholderia multivorans]|nr:APC family permease [Burkholderia multivorans]